MSAFFVTEQTIANAVQCLKLNGIAHDDMGRDLYRMNANALVQRYDDSIEEFEADIAAYAAPQPSQDLFQVFKSARCLLYQCSEGDVPSTCLFAELEKAADALAARLGGSERVQTDARYETAKWDA